MATETQPDQLIVQLEGKIIRVVSLNMALLTIGRTPENGLALAHQTISRHHADLRVTEQGVTLTDLGSANGTFLGSERLLANQPHLLSDGTTFRIGPFLLTYRVVKTPTVVADEEHEEPQNEAAPVAAESEREQEPVAEASPQEPQKPQEPVSEQSEQSLQDERPEREARDAVVEFAAVPRPTDVIPTILPEVPSEIAPVQSMTAAPKPAAPLRRERDENGSIYLGFLPDIFQEDDFLRRFLHIFEDIWEPLEQRQDHIGMYFDPRTCPASFLPWLASWLDLPFNPRWPEARHRRLLSAAMELYSWRGTAYGLTRMIEVCTGLTPLIRELPSQPFVFQIRIIMPPGASAEAVDKAFIEELIQAHKPAHAGYVLEVNI
ncbi:MAG TPA: phage tail protein I [Ktedonobacteraceae bacterium]|nr:phage tail protein I [Ktedonobacteraceae bacterium]